MFFLTTLRGFLFPIWFLSRSRGSPWCNQKRNPNARAAESTLSTSILGTGTKFDWSKKSSWCRNKNQMGCPVSSRDELLRWKKWRKIPGFKKWKRPRSKSKGSSDAHWRVATGSLAIRELFGCTTGAPEGDSMSVAAMTAVSWVFWLKVSTPVAGAFCYADNWSWMTTEMRANLRCFDVLIHLTRILRLQIDFDKSWAWLFFVTCFAIKIVCVTCMTDQKMYPLQRFELQISQTKNGSSPCSS